MTAALAGAGRAPSWYRTGGPFLPDTFCSLPRQAYYFSAFHRVTTASQQLAGKPHWQHGRRGLLRRLLRRRRRRRRRITVTGTPATAADTGAIGLQHTS
jgi:hypothetical protein